MSEQPLFDADADLAEQERRAREVFAGDEGEAEQGETPAADAGAATRRRERPQGWGPVDFVTEPVGAVLRVGHKDGRGVPVDKDRFEVCQPGEVDGSRPPHPSFQRFNSAAPEHRRRVLGRLVHFDITAAFHLQRMAYRLPKRDFPAPPGKRAACEGDGRTATRWLGEEKGGWQEIKCPGDLCEYAQASVCKPLVQVLFRPEWAEGSRLPRPLMRWSGRGLHSLHAALGMWDFVAGIAHRAGLLPTPVEEPGAGWHLLREHKMPVAGLPFALTLEEGTNPEKRTRFPIVRMTAEGDLVAWMQWQLRSMTTLQEGATLLALPSLRTEGDDEVAADVIDLEPGIPAEED